MKVSKKPTLQKSVFFIFIILIKLLNYSKFLVNCIVKQVL